MEAVRLVALVQRLDATVTDRLAGIFEKDIDSDVKAWAAFGLRRQGRKSDSVAIGLVNGNSEFKRMVKPPGADALPALLKLLEHENAVVRSQAGWTLGQWGHQEQALPALLKLLEDEDAVVRMLAARIMSQWAQQEKIRGSAIIAGVLLRELKAPSLSSLLARSSRHVVRTMASTRPRLGRFWPNS